MVLVGDCREVLKTLESGSIDAIVTDPPYELGFMGKAWDGTGVAYDVEVWRECLRVLKPGGHLLAFGGSRTYHRLACAVEDAGFQIRDQIMWVYAQGFPKSLNVKKSAKDQICQCGVEWSYGTDTQGTESETEHGMRSMQESDLSQTIYPENQQREILLPPLPEHGVPTTRRSEPEKRIEVGKEPSVEGRDHTQKSQRELQGSAVHPLPPEISADGSQGRLHNGTPASNGSMDREDADTDGGSQSQEPQPIRQPQREFGTIPNERGSQAWRGWQICGRCSKPIVEGIGSALKPAHEPIVLARKPLDGTVASNVLVYGVGGLNIDGCRVTGSPVPINKLEEWSGFGQKVKPAYTQEMNDQGRWPANFIHDGSDEVLELFPETKGGVAVRRNSGGNTFGGDNPKPAMGDLGYGDSGSAARFFYCPKANKSDRNEGLDHMPEVRSGGMTATLDGTMLTGSGNERTTTNRNHHPTVKPTDLMRYLCRLVTPPNGLILDPFTGSGSTGKAAVLEGFRFVGIEQSAEYATIAEARIAAAS